MQVNDFVRINYLGKIKEGEHTLDSGEDIPLILGVGYVMKGVDKALLEMNVSEKRTVEIEPKDGFGERDQTLIRLVRESEFKKHNQNPYPGMVIDADGMRGRVLSAASGRVKIDFNHPLAGRILVYELEIKQKIEDPKEKIRAIIEYYAKTKEIKLEVHFHEKEVEIIMPPVVNPLYKKKIADDVMRFLGFDKVKFSEVFERPKES
jgi:FKBP-type peptidyl-prolyl cis-trans isomerase 2